MTSPINITLTCYYFETFIVTWRKQPQAMLSKQKMVEVTQYLT